MQSRCLRTNVKLHQHHGAKLHIPTALQNTTWRISEPKRDQVKRDRRKMNNELPIIYSLCQTLLGLSKKDDE